MPPLDLDRFRKCAALMRGGATVGERAAGEAAARRVAAAAGLTLAEALGLGDAAAPPRAASRPAPPRTPPQPTPPMRAGPITVEELIAEKARQGDWLKRRAAREARRLRAVYAQQEAASAALRAEQARTDRERDEARGREPAGP